MNKLKDVIEEFPWLEALPPSCCWAWVAMVCYVGKHAEEAGVIRDVPACGWAVRLGVSVNDFRVMLAAARHGGAIGRKPGRKAPLVVECLAHPMALASSTLRVRKYRGKVVYTVREAQNDRIALKARGFKTPTKFAHAWMVGMNLMSQKGIDDVHVLLMRHWLSEEGKVPPCAITWLNSFVGSSIGRKVNLTEGMTSRAKTTRKSSKLVSKRSKSS